MEKIACCILVLMTIFCFACSNELDLTGEYKDTPIVYGVLDPSDAVHYIRIQKAFLVDGNVLQAVKIGDSLTYNPADLHVAVWPSDKYGQTYGPPCQFTYQSTVVTDTGMFTSNGAMIYSSTASLGSYYYKLVVTNTRLNKEITAFTPIVENAGWIKPSFGSVHLLGDQPYEMKWPIVSTAVIYQPEIKFYWEEVDLVTGDSHLDSLIFKYFPLSPTPTEKMENMMTRPFDKLSFFKIIQKEVPVKTNVKRAIGTLTFTLYTGPKDLE